MSDFVNNVLRCGYSRPIAHSRVVGGFRVPASEVWAMASRARGQRTEERLRTPRRRSDRFWHQQPTLTLWGAAVRDAVLQNVGDSAHGLGREGVMKVEQRAPRAADGAAAADTEREWLQQALHGL